MININTVNTKAAEAIHKAALEKQINDNITNSELPEYIKKFLNENLEDILVGTPSVLIRVNSEFYNNVRCKEKKKFNLTLEKIFRYDLFSSKKVSYNAYELADNLKIDCCPNCNREYTVTINSKSASGQLTRPDFDHYFPQSNYPLLVLSFYNLIPSCKICNSTFKGSEEMDIERHLHPYIHNVINEYSFNYHRSSKDYNKCGEIVIEIPNGVNKDRIEKTFDLFKIKEVYNGHKFVVDKILQLKQMFNDDYLRILSENTYNDLQWSKEEVYEAVFGIMYKDEDLYKNPFSKLKKDILEKEELLSLMKVDK